MDNSDAKWIEENMPEEPKEEFESQLFLSTDGKMTVSIKATTPEGRKAGARYAKDMYFWLKENFGSKQGYAVKEYKSAEENGHGEGWCSLHHIEMKQYTKNGRSWYAHKLQDETWCNGGKK